LINTRAALRVSSKIAHHSVGVCPVRTLGTTDERSSFTYKYRCARVIWPQSAIAHDEGAFLFADQNKNARRQRDKIEEQNGRAEINAKTHESVDDQKNRG